MLKFFFLPAVLAILSYGLWVSPNFKDISSGVAIFMLGMLALEHGFKSFTGGILEKILKFSTDRIYKSILFGALSTSVMQSSSLISLLTISFLGAGLLGLTQAIGIVFGANLGTTTGAWLIAYYGLKIDIAAYAMPMLVFGVVFMFENNKTLKGLAYVLIGLGFLFLGIEYMKNGFEAFKSTIDLSTFAISGIKGLLIFSAIGVFATLVMQSSHATLVLLLTALAAGQISYENALALAIGANVGTTITAIIGSLGSNVDGKRLAAAHLIFNLSSAFLAIVFIHQLILLVDIGAAFLGIGAADYTLKLALFHTIFNLLGLMIMLPFMQRLVAFLETNIKPKIEEEGAMAFESAKYLTDAVLAFPQSTKAAILRESRHLYENAFEIIAHGLNLKRSAIVSDMDFDEVLKQPYAKKIADIDALYNHKIKDIYGAILDFATKAQANMSQNDIKEVYRLKLANRDLVEAVKDTKHLQKNILKYASNPNKQIRDEYLNIKKSLAHLLRYINAAALSEAQDEIVIALAKAKAHIEKHDLLSNGTLDNLIRNQLITNQMATSLMNDSYYAFNIGKNLIAMAEVVFLKYHEDLTSIHPDTPLTQTSEEVVL
ncbi:MAG: Na/Pi symporter [Sulfurimonas sp.]|nr:Na/Pi symporter [Sulfurimonas sp.]MDD3059647.1 Na/Pi symporter [Sulfurimonas sp.]MDD5203391.1 Na/Pi symporter [Sulfurimonas sp.]